MTVRRIVTTAGGGAPFEQLPGTLANVPTVEIDDVTGIISVADKQIIPTVSPGGSNSQVQINSGGTFGGNSGLVYDETTKTAAVGPDVSLRTGVIFLVGSENVVPGIINSNSVGIDCNLLTDASGVIEGITGTVWVANQAGGLSFVSVLQSDGVTFDGASSTLAKMAGLRITSNAVNSGTVTNNYGISVDDQGTSGAAKNTAVHVSAQSNGGTAIKVDGGANDLGPNGTSLGQLTITAPAVPLTNISVGVAGEVAWDSGFVYVCVNANVWARAAISTNW